MFFQLFSGADIRLDHHLFDQFVGIKPGLCADASDVTVFANLHLAFR